MTPNNGRRDEVLIAVLTGTLKEKLNHYPTSVAEDEKLLQKTDLPKRHRMAVEVRLGEKRLLQEALASLKVREAGEQNGVDENRATKRRRTET